MDGTAVAQPMCMIMYLGLLFIMALTGCTTLNASEPPIPQISLRIATRMMAGQARLSEQDIAGVLFHLDRLEETLSLAFPRNFDDARTHVNASTSGDERMLLLIVIDPAENPPITASRTKRAMEGHRIQRNVTRGWNQRLPEPRKGWCQEKE